MQKSLARLAARVADATSPEEVPPGNQMTTMTVVTLVPATPQPVTPSYLPDPGDQMAARREV